MRSCPAAPVNFLLKKREDWHLIFRVNGLLLINVGTPQAPTQAAVRRYLREFLSDPRVIDIHPILRALLLHVVILPLRPRRSAAAYKKIWTEHGSPLLHHGLELARAVQEQLGAGWRVRLGMRYGEPSIHQALAELLPEIERLVVLPLYPQEASSSTGSAVEAVFAALSRLEVPPPVSVVERFFDAPGFLDAFVSHGAPVLARERPDHVLFSFHGLPERQIKKADASGRHCLTHPDCCAKLVAENRHCYRAQCFATARLLAERLGISEGDFSVCFQSRLGRTPWIAPYTDHVLPELIAQGKRRVVVFCPAFVADCLETLEEIGLRAREDFLRQGGTSLVLVPSLNTAPAWVAEVVGLARRHGHSSVEKQSGGREGERQAERLPLRKARETESDG